MGKGKFYVWKGKYIYIYIVIVNFKIWKWWIFCERGMLYIEKAIWRRYLWNMEIGKIGITKEKFNVKDIYNNKIRRYKNLTIQWGGNILPVQLLYWSCVLGLYCKRTEYWQCFKINFDPLFREIGFVFLERTIINQIQN